jgi:hypothetical protein
MDVCLLWVLCVVRQRADHSSRGVLPTVVRRYVWSRNIVNEEGMAHWGGYCAKLRIAWSDSGTVNLRVQIRTRDIFEFELPNTHLWHSVFNNIILTFYMAWVIWYIHDLMCIQHGTSPTVCVCVSFCGYHSKEGPFTLLRLSDWSVRNK